MKIKLLILLMLLLGFSIIKSETKKVEEITMFSNELRGFEADYPATRHVSAAHVE